MQARLRLVLAVGIAALMGSVAGAAVGETPTSADFTTGAWLHPDMAQYGVTLENVETISTSRLLYLIEQGHYRPAADSDLWAALDAKYGTGLRSTSGSSSLSSAPPFEANVRVNSDTSGNQAEVSMDSDETTGNLYAGWNHGNFCGYAGSTDGGKIWSPVEQYRNGNSWCGDTVIVGHGGVMWRLAMSSVSGGAQEDISKSTDGGKTWGSWIKANPGAASTNDKPWMDFEGTHIYIAVYDSGPINFFKSDDDGATWSTKKNLGTGQGNCVLAGNNGVVLVGWTHNSANMQRSSDYGANFASVKSGFTQGGEGSSPRTGSLAGCAADSAKKNMYYSWTASEGSGQRKTWVMASTDEGATWGAPVRVSQSANRMENQGIDVTSDGVVHSAWMEFISGQSHAMYSNSSDNGATWITPIEVSDGSGAIDTSFMGHYAALDASKQGRIGYAFACARSGDVDVWYGGYNYKGGGGGGGGTITRIDVTPSTATITADQTQQLSAKAFDVNNNQVNATFAWTASGGTVDANGLYTPQATGTFDVTATSGTISGKSVVTVTHGVAVSLAVTPANPSVAADQTLRFAAEGKDAKGNAWPISPATWTVAGGAGAGAIDSGGLYTPDKVGTYTIEGADPASTLKGTTQVTVTPGAVATITLTPATVKITADETQQFSASAADSKGNPISPVWSWTTTGGTVSSSGLYSPDKIGTFNVQASAGGKSASASIEVTPGALAKIVVSPGGQTITADASLQFTAKGEDAKGNSVTIAPSWNAENGQVSATGEFTPVKSGDWKITAAQSGISGMAMVKVTPGALASLVIDPPSSTLAKSDTVKFTLTAADAKGNEVTVFDTKWTLAGDAIGDLDQKGSLTAKAAGEATVRAESTAGGGTEIAEAKVIVPGGLLDMKAGGQLPFLLIGIIAAVVAIGVAAALAGRRRRKAAQAQGDWYAQNPYGPPPMYDQSQYGAPPGPPAPPQTSPGASDQPWPPPPTI
ncbi:MAG TPA: Ig-like domain-containing protein [Thermoplasmata archaeon]|nr:Ig-like domain-containing protein [Thermoplasmata archaeon]